MVISINTDEAIDVWVDRIVNCKEVEWPAPQEGMEKFAFSDKQIKRIIGEFIITLAVRKFAYGEIEEAIDAEEGKIDSLPIPKQIEDEIRRKIKDD